MLEPFEKEIELSTGGVKVYTLHKFPAVSGREIITQYPISAAPKVGDYKRNEELMLKLMGYVSVPGVNGNPLFLKTRELIDNHVPDSETLMRIEWAMMQYNSAFFQNGKLFDFLGYMEGKLGTFLTQTLTDFSRSLLKKD